jgi:3-oxoacyl-[acyl-carrier protein] reductase
MDLGLADKTALVTGGSSGIGLAISQRLGAEGCRVAICGRDEGRLKNALAELPAGTRAAITDMEKPADVAQVVDDLVVAWGRIDIVVSNAGTHVPGRIDEVDTMTLSRHLQTKVVGLWELARRIAPHMRRQGGGRFIVVIGQSGKVPQANAIASCVVNAAQHAFVKSLSDELAPHKVLVNAVCPSRIRTVLTDGLSLHNEAYLGRSLEQQETRWGAEVPLGRWGTPHDVANAVAFLASGRAEFIVGANIDVDGGHQRSIF